VIFVEGACISAATVVMMAADEIEFCPWSTIMIHAYSGGVIGKYQEIQSSSEFHKQWFEKIVNDIYGEFLSKKEIAQILSGKDLWLTSDEALNRFNKIFKRREREYSKIRKSNETMMNKINEIMVSENKEKEDE
jgi:ATP-dependent protease ClpP protease subunit